MVGGTSSRGLGCRGPWRSVTRAASRYTLRGQWLGPSPADAAVSASGNPAKCSVPVSEETVQSVPGQGRGTASTAQLGRLVDIVEQPIDRSHQLGNVGREDARVDWHGAGGFGRVDRDDRQ